MADSDTVHINLARVKQESTEEVIVISSSESEPSPKKFCPKKSKVIYEVESDGPESQDPESQATLKFEDVEDSSDVPRHIRLQSQFRGSYMQYHNEDNQTPVLETDCATPYQHALAMQILLDKAVTNMYPTCSKVPKACTNNSVFLVDTKMLKSPKDLLADDNGKWKWGGQAKTSYIVHEHAENIDITYHDSKPKESESDSPKNIFVLKRSYWKHKTTDGKTSFRRSVTCVEREGKQLPVVIVHYYYEDGNEVPLVLSPHKNRKYGVQAHTRTQHSTLNELAASKKTPKETFSKSWAEKGGITEIESFSEVPRDQRQIYNARKNIQKGEHSSENRDEIMDLIALAKEHERRPDGGTIRNLLIHPDLSCLIASNQQLTDLVRFCTNHVDSTVLGVDSTFNIGKYDVTFTTYNNLLLETRVPDHNGRRHSPVMLGPSYVHHRKDFNSFYNFVSSLRCLRKELVNLIAFGTDGDEALINALVAAFPNATGLRCFLHSMRNLKMKMSEFNLQPIQAQVLLDIFGKQDAKEVIVGLLGAFDAQEFDEKLAILKSKWDRLETTLCHKSSLATSFHSWFSTYHAPYMRETMTTSVRACVGIKGSPTPWYTTNNNECINKVFKNEVSAKLSIAQCVEKIEEFLEAQSCQVELAITGEGLYQFRESYKDLEIPKEVWIKKSKDDKKKHVAKVMGCQVRPVANSQSDASMESRKTNVSGLKELDHTISISLAESGLSEAVSPNSLRNMWLKAESILNNDEICRPVGKYHDDDSARQVASESHPRLPHFVYQHKTGKVACDDCPLYKAFKVCQHSIAVAESRGALSQFLSWRKSLPKGRNSAAILTRSSLPMSTTGKKKNEKKKPPRKRAVSSTTTRAFIDPLDHAALDEELAVADEPLSSSFPMTQSLNASYNNTNNRMSSATIQPTFHPQPWTSPAAQSFGQQHTTFQSQYAQLLGATQPPIINQQSPPGSTLGTRYSQIHSTFQTQYPPLLSADQPPVFNQHHHHATTANQGIEQQLRMPFQPQYPQTATAQLPFSRFPTSSTTPHLQGTNQWFSSNSPYPYELVMLSNRVKKCYGCGQEFAECYRREPKNVVVRHFDKRVKGKDQHGNLTYTQDFQATYYHPNPSHILKKNHMFNGRVSMASQMWQNLSDESKALINSSGLYVNLT